MILSQSTPSAPYPSRQLNILLHYRDPLRMYCTKIRVLEQVDEEGLCGLLQRLYCLRLPQKRLANGRKRLGNFSDLIGDTLDN